MFFYDAGLEPVVSASEQIFCFYFMVIVLLILLLLVKIVDKNVCVWYDIRVNGLVYTIMENTEKKVKIKKRLSPFQIIVLGFAVLIMLGTLLLMMPFASVEGVTVGFWDAIFTATSCVCVTGLVVLDTATSWTFFGQLVIITLIQIGGLGVVTVVVGFTMSFGKKIGLMQRNTMQSAISAPQLGGIMRLTNYVIKCTLVIELIGAILLSCVFVPDFGLAKGVWMGVFTSISAFCNAGFDLMGATTAGNYSSLIFYKSNIIINTVIMLLIIIGGLGFSTWNDFKEHKLNFKRFRMQSRVVLTMTMWLIILPAVYLFVFEFTRPCWNDLSLQEKILASIFQSVTPRTAGFNTVELSQLAESSQLIMILLMLIGAAPGSTAGGMKITTFSVLLATAFSVFRRKNDTNWYGRRISSITVKHASTIFMMYVVLFLTSSVAVSAIENVPIMSALFECGSALGTVGLTLGITTALSIPSRIILMILMFLGRVGGLTLIFATTSSKLTPSRLPEENITVG